MEKNNSGLPQNKPLYEQVCELIETQIINGELGVGDQLPTENELSEKYKVSRTVIREATKVLKEKGWVESFAGRGTFIIDNTERGLGSSLDAIVRMNPETGFDHLLEVREILEPEMAALAAAKASQDQIDQMQAVVDLMNSSLEGLQPLDEFLNADHKFHNLLAEATGNPLIIMLIKSLGILIRRQQQFMTYQVAGGPKKSQRHHVLILETIKKHDSNAARKRMHDHIHQVYLDVHSMNNPE